ncbi:hypothetical protein EK904_014475 [Melospiza melodia maxima]|nr:hypothetical protein EK904_014475 [Melospiza melodia maxima]
MFYAGAESALRVAISDVRRKKKQSGLRQMSTSTEKKPLRMKMTQNDAESASLGMILCMKGKYMTFSWLTVT